MGDWVEEEMKMNLQGILRELPGKKDISQRETGQRNWVEEEMKKSRTVAEEKALKECNNPSSVLWRIKLYQRLRNDVKYDDLTERRTREY